MATVHGELKPSKRILLGPGPSNVNPRVYKAMGTSMLGYMDAEFIAIMDETVAMLRQVFGTQNELTIPVSGTGTSGMEAALCNVIEPGDRVVVCIKGYFGLRLKEIAERCGANVTVVESDWGTAVQPDKVERALKGQDAKLVAIVHAETSTGVLQPLDEIGAIANDSGALLLVDCVTSLGGQAVNLDQRKIDVAYSGTQKCLGAPPGLAPVSFSVRAREVIAKRRSKVQSFYFDMTLLEKYWTGGQRAYHHTVSMTLVYALREALRVVLEEGLEARYLRHARNAEALRAGLVAMGLDLIAEEGHRAPMLTTVAIPKGIADGEIRNSLMAGHGIEIGGGLGDFKGKAWRIGLMGESSTQSNVLLVLSALEKLLSGSGHKLKPGAGVSAAVQLF